MLLAVIDDASPIIPVWTGRKLISQLNMHDSWIGAINCVSTCFRMDSERSFVDSILGLKAQCYKIEMDGDRAVEHLNWLTECESHITASVIQGSRAFLAELSDLDFELRTMIASLDLEIHESNPCIDLRLFPSLQRLRIRNPNDESGKPKLIDWCVLQNGRLEHLHLVNGNSLFRLSRPISVRCLELQNVSNRDLDFGPEQYVTGVESLSVSGSQGLNLNLDHLLQLSQIEISYSRHCVVTSTNRSVTLRRLHLWLCQSITVLDRVSSIELCCSDLDLAVQMQQRGMRSLVLSGDVNDISKSILCLPRFIRISIHNLSKSSGVVAHRLLNHRQEDDPLLYRKLFSVMQQMHNPNLLQRLLEDCTVEDSKRFRWQSIRTSPPQQVEAIQLMLRIEDERSLQIAWVSNILVATSCIDAISRVVVYRPWIINTRFPKYRLTSTTLLHEFSSVPTLVRILLAQGADPFALDCNGKTALERTNNPEAIQLLEEAMSSS